MSSTSPYASVKGYDPEQGGHDGGKRRDCTQWANEEKRKPYVLGGAAVLAVLFLLSYLVNRNPPVGLRGLTQLAHSIQTASTHVSSPNSPKVCVIGRTYGAQVSYLPLFLLSLWHSGFPNLQVFLLNTDASMPTSELARASDLVNLLVGKNDFATFLDFPLYPPGDFGYGLTDDVLLWLYEGKGRDAGCEYITISNGDNLYAETMADYLRVAFEKNADLIGWDFISHHTWHDPILAYDGSKRYNAREGRNVHKEAEFQIAFIDLGAAMFRLDFLRQHNLTFLSTGGYGWVSDGQFIEAANARAATTFMQHSTLLLHQ